MDLSSGKRYYYHKQTLEFRIERPEEVEIVVGRIAMYPDQQSGNVEPEEEGWKVYVDPSTGRPFYYHSGTHENRWDNPCGLTIEETDYAGKLEAVPADKIVRAPVGKRLYAAAIDTGIAAAAAAASGLVMAWELEALQLGFIGGVYVFALGLIARDAMNEDGTRSIGKKIAGLEIVTQAGEVPSRYRTVARNIYLVGAIAVVDLFPYAELALLANGVPWLFGKGRRLGDFLGGTVVIEEQPRRKERVRGFNDYWLKRDADTDWRKVPSDVAEAMQRAKVRAAESRVAEMGNAAQRESSSEEKK